MSTPIGEKLEYIYIKRKDGIYTYIFQLLLMSTLIREKLEYIYIKLEYIYILREKLEYIYIYTQAFTNVNSDKIESMYFNQEAGISSLNDKTEICRTVHISQ